METEMSHSEHIGPSSVDAFPENGAVILSSSSATDSLLSDPQFTEYQKNSTISHLQEAGDVSMLLGDSTLSSQELTYLCERSEPERTRRKEKCNMRKSLAWDAAFFTSAGVLDPDELSGMIKKDDKSGKHLLPVITEDLSRSTDSISMLGSEISAMESIEADLMQDIRASIQKSSKATDTTGSRKIASALEKTDIASKYSAKLKAGTKKQNTSVPGLGRLAKKNPDCSQGTQACDLAGTKKQNTSVPGLGRLAKKNPDCSQGTQIAPKVIGRRIPTTSASMERATLSANQVKLGGVRANGSTVPGKVAPRTKTPGLCGSTGTALKPPLCMKSSFNSLGTSKKDPQKRCVSSESSSSASSTNVGKSLIKSKITSRIVTPTSSRSMTTVPAKVGLKAKRPTSLSASSMSSMLSSNISPASSISDWSSEASSSVSTVNRRSTSRTTDIRPPYKTRDNNVPLAAGRPKHSNDQILTRNEKKVSQPAEGKVKAASSQVGMLSGTATTKPSGLRIPSPNMGYFDGAKSAVHTPKRSPQPFSATPASSRNGRGIQNISGSLSKTHALNTSKTDISARKRSSPIPASSSASSICRSSLNASPRVKSLESGQNCLKGEEIGPIRAKPDPKGTDEIGNTGILEREMNLQKLGDTKFEDAKIDCVEGDACSSRPICNIEHVREVRPFRAQTDVEGAKVTESIGVLESKMNSPKLVANIGCIEGDTCPLGSICNAEHVKEVGPVRDNLDTDDAEGTMIDIGVLESVLNLQNQGDINTKDANVDCIAELPEHEKEIGCVRAKPDTDGAEETGNTGILESEMNSHKQGVINSEDAKIDYIAGDTYSICNDEHVKEVESVGANPDLKEAEETGNKGVSVSETKLQLDINLKDAEHIRLSEEMGEDKLHDIQYPKNSLNSVCENKESTYPENQVDKLSIPAETKDSKQGAGIELIEKPLSQTDSGHRESYLKEGSPSNLSSASRFSHSLTTLETGMSTRTPLTVMNSLCNDEGFNPPATMNSKVVKKTTTTFPSLESTLTENI